MVAVLRLEAVTQRVDPRLDHAAADVTEFGRDVDRAHQRPFFDILPRERRRRSLHWQSAHPPEVERDGGLLAHHHANAALGELLDNRRVEGRWRRRLLCGSGQAGRLAGNVPQEKCERESCHARSSAEKKAPGIAGASTDPCCPCCPCCPRLVLSAVVGRGRQPADAMGGRRRYRRTTTCGRTAATACPGPSPTIPASGSDPSRRRPCGTADRTTSSRRRTSGARTSS